VTTYPFTSDAMSLEGFADICDLRLGDTIEVAVVHGGTSDGPYRLSVTELRIEDEHGGYGPSRRLRWRAESLLFAPDAEGRAA